MNEEEQDFREETFSESGPDETNEPQEQNENANLETPGEDEQKGPVDAGQDAAGAESSDASSRDDFFGTDQEKYSIRIQPQALDTGKELNRLAGADQIWLRKNLNFWELEWNQSRIVVINRVDGPANCNIALAEQLRKGKAAMDGKCYQVNISSDFWEPYQLLLELRMLRNLSNHNHSPIVVTLMEEGILDPASDLMIYLRSVTDAGNSFRRSLEELNIFLIYLCSRRDLCYKHKNEPLPFTLVTFSEWHTLLYALDADMNGVSAWLRPVERALFEYGWLDAQTTKDRTNKLQELYNSNLLKDTAEAYISEKEKEVGSRKESISGQPIHQVILFTGVFFPKLPVSEFYRIVEQQLYTTEKEGPYRYEEGQIRLAEWADNADRHLKECSLKLAGPDEAEPGYYFEGRMKPDAVLRDWEKGRTTFQLWHYFMRLRHRIVLSDRPATTALESGFFTLAETAARRDAEEALQQTALLLLSKTAKSAPKELSRVYGRRWERFMRNWITKDSYRDMLSNLFAAMRIEPDGRRQLAWLLARNCRPGKEHLLQELKRLLGAMADTERSAGLAAIQSVIVQYAASIETWIQTVAEWVNTQKSPIRARLFASNGARDMLSNVAWADAIARQPAYELIRQWVNEDGRRNLYTWLRFIFSPEARNDLRDWKQSDWMRRKPVPTSYELEYLLQQEWCKKNALILLTLARIQRELNLSGPATSEQLTRYGQIQLLAPALDVAFGGGDENPEGWAAAVNDLLTEVNRRINEVYLNQANQEWNITLREHLQEIKKLLETYFQK